MLFALLKKNISDDKVLWLVREIIDSYHFEGTPRKGMPIGNLTSQIFTNIYLNELDQFVKHELKMKYYLRFADDLLFLSHDRESLENVIPKLKDFLEENLLLTLHPKKVFLRPLTHGIDFLGYVTLPHHRVLRTKTKRRVKRKLSERLQLYHEKKITSESLTQTMASYWGVLSHANTFRYEQQLRNQFCWKR